MTIWRPGARRMRRAERVRRAVALLQIEHRAGRLPDDDFHMLLEVVTGELRWTRAGQ